MRVLPVAAVSFAVAVSVSACSGGGTSVAANTSMVAVSSPPVSASASPSSTVPVVPTTGPNVLPGATPPVISALAKQETPTGAAAFVASYTRALDWAYSTTDSTILKPYFGENCSGCSNASSGFDDAKAAGQHYIGGHLTTKSSEQEQLPGGTVADQVINVTVAATKLQTLDSANHVLFNDAAEVATFQYVVHWAAGTWKMVRITYVPPPANE